MMDIEKRKEKIRCSRSGSRSGIEESLSRAYFLSIICILLFGTSIGLALNYNSGAWDTTKNAYEKANIVSYSEWDCIPIYFEVINDGKEAVTETKEWCFDYSNKGYTGILGFECCGCTGCPPANPVGCCNPDPDLGPDISTCAVESQSGPTTWELVSTTGDIWCYEWTYTINPGETIRQCACAKLSMQAAQFPGASLQLTGPAGTTSIPTKSLRTPDLNVQKSAAQDCDEITYTITYNNAVTSDNFGGADDINVKLVDTYDKTKLTPIAGSISDGGVLDLTAGTITWTFATLPIGGPYTQTWKATINDGGCTADSIVNKVDIDGDKTDRHTEDNTYTLTTTVVPDTTVPVFTGCPTEPIALGCIETLPDCDDVLALGVTANDNCDGPITPTCTPGTIVENG